MHAGEPGQPPGTLLPLSRALEPNSGEISSRAAAVFDAIDATEPPLTPDYCQQTREVPSNTPVVSIPSPMA